MPEFIYNPVEYEWRRGLLKRAGNIFENYMGQHSRIARVTESPSKILTWGCEVRPVGYSISSYIWENLHGQIYKKAQQIVEMINQDSESRVGDRQMRYHVSSGPVYRWVGSALNLDLDTGKLPSGRELRKIGVMFSFPETLK